MIEIVDKPGDPYFWVYLVKGAIRGGPNKQLLIHENRLEELIIELLKKKPEIFVKAFVEFSAEFTQGIALPSEPLEDDSDVYTFYEGWIRGWLSR